MSKSANLASFVKADGSIDVAAFLAAQAASHGDASRFAPLAEKQVETVIAALTVNGEVRIGLHELAEGVVATWTLPQGLSKAAASKLAVETIKRRFPPTKVNGKGETVYSKGLGGGIILRPLAKVENLGPAKRAANK